MQIPPKKKILLTPKRTLELADSLDKKGTLKIINAVEFRREKAKAGTYENKYMSDKFIDDIAEDGSNDISKSVRYRKLAEAAKKAKINR